MNDRIKLLQMSLNIRTYILSYRDAGEGMGHASPASGE